MCAFFLASNTDQGKGLVPFPLSSGCLQTGVEAVALLVKTQVGLSYLGKGDLGDREDRGQDVFEAALIPNSSVICAGMGSLERMSPLLPGTPSLHPPYSQLQGICLYSSSSYPCGW